MCDWVAEEIAMALNLGDIWGSGFKRHGVKQECDSLLRYRVFESEG
jgi:hypothetical protein